MKSGYKEIGFGKQTIAKVFEEWYTVPSYQRHYVWESDNVNDMLEDYSKQRQKQRFVRRTTTYHNPLLAFCIFKRL